MGKTTNSTAHNTCKTTIAHSRYEFLRQLKNVLPQGRKKKDEDFGFMQSFMRFWREMES